MSKTKPDGEGLNIDIWHGAVYEGSLFRSGSTCVMDELKADIEQNTVGLSNVADFLKNHTGVALAMIYEELQKAVLTDDLRKAVDDCNFNSNMTAGVMCWDSSGNRINNGWYVDQLNSIWAKLDRIEYLLEHHAQ